VPARPPKHRQAHREAERRSHKGRRSTSGSPTAAAGSTPRRSITVTNQPGISPAPSNAAAITGTGEEDVLTGLGGNNRLNGLGGNDTLVGGGGNDVLDGGTGADSMAGDTGNDRYLVDNAQDIVSEAAGQGTDTVVATLGNYILGSNVEILAFQGTGGFIGTGNATNNAISGLAGADRLDGGRGADVLAGGQGNDVYVFDTSSDVAIEFAGGGTDSIEVVGGNNYTIAQNVENLTYLGTYAGIAQFTANGNGLANTMIGGAGADRLDGRGGADLLSGSNGSDTFVFRSGYGPDRILDFAATGTAEDFVELGGAGFTSFLQLQASGAVAQVGSNVEVTLGPADKLTIANVTVANVSDDFLFVA
jgi:Ca2+-binding RTX toxin-like protein